MFHHVSIIFNVPEPKAESIAIEATERLVIVAIVVARPAETPNVVSVMVNNGTRAIPPVATTATIANTAPITIVTVVKISFQCFLHHSPTFFAAVFEFLPTAFFTFGLHVVVLVVKIVFALNNSQSLYSCILLQLLIASKSCETFSWFVGILSPP